jgi:hypothetical protein
VPLWGVRGCVCVCVCVCVRVRVRVRVRVCKSVGVLYPPSPSSHATDCRMTLQLTDEGRQHD